VSICLREPHRTMGSIRPAEVVIRSASPGLWVVCAPRVAALVQPCSNFCEPSVALFGFARSSTSDIVAYLNSAPTRGYAFGTSQ
jgi:hypothetical protein